MTSTLARIKRIGKNFEIIVNMEEALKFKKGQGFVSDFLESEFIFSDSKKGLKPKENELKSAFGTTDVEVIAERIVKEGEIQVTQEHRSEERDAKIKQVVDFLSRNSVDPQTGRPHTPDRIKSALNEAGVNIKNVSIEVQIQEIVQSLSPFLPIKLEVKKFKAIIPAIHTGKSYGIINQYKIKENWLSNGDLEVVVEVPAGLVMDFFDKLNSVTHGSAATQEIKE